MFDVWRVFEADLSDRLADRGIGAHVPIAHVVTAFVQQHPADVDGTGLERHLIERWPLLTDHNRRLIIAAAMEGLADE